MFFDVYIGFPKYGASIYIHDDGQSSGIITKKKDFIFDKLK